MGLLKNMRYLIVLNLIFFNAISYVQAATPVVVAIQLNNPPNVIPGPTKHFQICDGQFRLSASNISTTKPTSIPIYEWVNLDSSNPPQVGTDPSITSNVIGRWVATIKYYNSATTQFDIKAQDTIFLTNYPSVPFNIVTTAEVPITIANITICGSKDSTIGATNGFSNYNWYKNSSSNLLASTRQLTLTTTMINSSEGNISFFVTAKDPNGCNATKQVYIRRTADIAIDIVGPNVACNGETVVLESPSSPTPAAPYTFQWSTGATGTKSISTSVGGTYWLRITHTTLKCSVIDYHTLVAGAGAGITISPDTSICFGTPATLTASMPGNATYTWNGPGLANANGATQVITPTAAGLNTYTVDVTSNAGCPGSKTTNVTVLAPGVNPYFSITAGNDTTLCNNTSGKLKAAVTSSAYPATYTWQWSPATGLDNVTAQQPTLTSSDVGLATYSVIATDNRGCVKNSSVNVNILSPLTTTTNFIDSITCFGKNVQIQSLVTGGIGRGYVYSFDPPSGIVTGNTMIVVTGTGKDIYRVSATDSIGCLSNVVNVSVEGYAPPVRISNSKDTTGFTGVPLELNANTPSSNDVTWYNISGIELTTGPVYVSSSTEKVYAYVKDPIKGCTNADTISISFFEGDPYALFVPTIFSPKASNVENTRLKVYGNLIQEDGFHFRIYNQWGQMVYQSSSFIDANESGWTGDIKGSEGSQSTNVYTYTVEGKFYDGKEFSKTGTTTLLQ